MRLTRLLSSFVSSIRNIRSKQIVARRKRLNFRQAISLVETVCHVAGSKDIITDAQRNLQQSKANRAIRQHDDHVIFDWFFEAASFQGVSDAAAEGYIRANGKASSAAIEIGLATARCDKLSSHWAFTDCRYRKTARKCSHPALLPSCPVPALNERNGSLSQMAHGLYLFFRDVCNGDFVDWVDRRLGAADPEGLIGGRILVEPLSHVHGISSKVASMTLATLLLGGDPNRLLWQAVGADMIAIDTLVHYWFVRTGILRGLDVEHSYGSTCYSAGHCADIIRAAASKIDSRAFNPGYPARFPRHIQQALWRFCAQQQLAQCNGINVDDRSRCKLRNCVLFDRCGRVRLGRQALNRNRREA
jgi:hypothetical protein